MTSRSCSAYGVLFTPPYCLCRSVGLTGKVKTTPEKLLADGFGATPRFHCLIAEVGGHRVAFALYFYIYSTWEGPSLYLEDLYVAEAARGQGVGLTLMRHLAQLVLDEGCARFQWWVAPRALSLAAAAIVLADSSASVWRFAGKPSTGTRRPSRSTRRSSARRSASRTATPSGSTLSCAATLSFALSRALSPPRRRRRRSRPPAYR
jgi:GNAT superfamily N-acetyltransferase